MAIVGINAQLLSDRSGYRRAGIHHYIAQLLSHLPPDDDLCYRVFAGQAADLPGIPLDRTRWPTHRPIARILWEQLFWPVAAARHNVSLLHSMAFVIPVVRPCPAVVTVYDLSFIHFPDRFPPLQRLYLASQTRRSCRAARRVVTISESGRQDVHTFFGVPLERIDVVSPGVDSYFQPRPPGEVEAFRRQQELPPRFILHVGTLQPRKNIPFLIDAFARLATRKETPPDLVLVLVGGKGWMYDSIFARVEELELVDRIRFTGYVSDDELPLWYNAAALLVFPSVYEGFGMPVVQAMACGTPVVAAATSAIPEAAGGAALLFDPADEAALADRIESVLHNRARADIMRRDGLVQAQAFSWQASGQKMAAIYRELLAARREAEEVLETG